MSSSPYSKTTMTNSGTLDILTIRPVPAYADDPIYTIEPQYNHRPDLLAFDLVFYYIYTHVYSYLYSFIARPSN